MNFGDKNLSTPAARYNCKNYQFVPNLTYSYFCQFPTLHVSSKFSPSPSWDLFLRTSTR